MLISTIFPAGVEEADLVALITQISKVSGYPVTVEKQVVATTDNIDLSGMLDNLADAIRNGRGSIQAKPKALKRGRTPKLKIKKVRKAEGSKPEPTRGPHVKSWEIKETGEKISRFELNKRMRDFLISPGTELHHPKYGKIIVEMAPDGGALCLANEQGETI